MASLPVELLRLIYEYCDPPTVRCLRQVSRTLASIGYDYLLPPHFTAIGARNDAQRLHSIATHDCLGGYIKSLSFHFGMPEHNKDNDMVHILGFYMPGLDEVARRQALDKIFSGCSPLNYSSLVEEALPCLSKLKSIRVVQPKVRWGSSIPGEHVLVCRAQRMDVLLSAVRHCVLSSLALTYLPLEYFLSRKDRKSRWLNCSRAFATLSRLELTLDVPRHILPQATKRALNGLGYVLQFATGLQHLELGFVGGESTCIAISLQDLFRDFTFAKLTDLKLEGIACKEPDLSSFILRHASTLERLRLGGRGLAGASERSMGSMGLYDGSWRSFFDSLRCQLPRLKRFHMEGTMRGVFDPFRAVYSREAYFFHPVADDNWEQTDWLTAPTRCLADCDSLGLEKYIIEGGKYPELVTFHGRR